MGDELEISAPFGDIILEDSQRPVALLSAGIGVTPLAGMLDHLAKTGSTRTVQFLHADFNAASVPLHSQIQADIDDLQHGSLHLWLEEGAEQIGARTGYMNLEGFELNEGAVYYLCGPVVFMKAVRAQLLAAGVPAADIHYEVFGPDLLEVEAA